MRTGSGSMKKRSTWAIFSALSWRSRVALFLLGGSDDDPGRARGIVPAPRDGYPCSDDRRPRASGRAFQDVRAMSDLTLFGVNVVIGGFLVGLMVGMVLRIISHRR